MACEFCDSEGGTVIFREPKWRVVSVGGEEGVLFPGFCRVIWHAHVGEMSDLSMGDRTLFMAAVFAVEGALRRVFSPDKINLASLGNVTPHLHWHVIPRFKTDAAFPKPIWAVTLAANPSQEELDKLAKARLAAEHGQWARWEAAVLRELAKESFAS